MRAGAIETELKRGEASLNGSRELQMWRLKQLREGLPVVTARGKHIGLNPEDSIPNYTLLPRSNCPLPRDVLVNHLLPILAQHYRPCVIFDLMMTSKAFQAPAQQALLAMARRALGPNATTMALMCAEHYDELGEEMSHLARKSNPVRYIAPSGNKKRRTPGKLTDAETDRLRTLTKVTLKRIRLTALFHLPHRQSFALLDAASHDFGYTLVKRVIKAHGVFDVVARALPEWKERQKLAQDMEARWVGETTQGRLDRVNRVLAVRIGSTTALAIETQAAPLKCTFTAGPAAIAILSVFSKAPEEFLDKIDAFLSCKTTVSVETVVEKYIPPLSVADVGLFEAMVAACAQMFRNDPSKARKFIVKRSPFQILNFIVRSIPRDTRGEPLLHFVTTLFSQSVFDAFSTSGSHAFALIWDTPLHFTIQALRKADGVPQNIAPLSDTDKWTAAVMMFRGAGQHYGARTVYLRNFARL